MKLRKNTEFQKKMLFAAIEYAAKIKEEVREYAKTWVNEKLKEFFTSVEEDEIRNSIVELSRYRIWISYPFLL